MTTNASLCLEKKLFTKPKFLAVKFSPTQKVKPSLEKPDLNFPSESPTVINSRKSKENIFSLAKSISEDYEMTKKGPMIDEKGVYKSYTILGKPEWFKNYSNPDNKIQIASFSDAPENHKIMIPRPMTSYVGSQNRTGISTQQRPFSSKPLLEKKNFEETTQNKALEKIVFVLKKEEVLQEIDKIKSRLNHQRNNINKKKPLSAKFFINKEKNCLNHFEELEKKWEAQARFFSKKISRNKYDKPLYEKGECYRQKLEFADVVEQLKTDHEKFGDRYWELTLRKYENREKQCLLNIKNEEIEKDKNFNQINTEKNVRPLSANVEAIRNPKKQYNEIPFSSFQSDKYLRKKLERVKDETDLIHPLTKPKELGSLYVNKTIMFLVLFLIIFRYKEKMFIKKR